MRVSDLTAWARGSGLEIILLVLGAMLVSRLLRGASTRVVARLQPTAADGTMPVASEEAKHTFALVQAGERMTIGLIWFMTTVLVLIRFNVPLTTLVAPATVIGVGLGFGAQRIVADLLAGFFLISERQYGVGDIIQVAPAGQMNVTGTVEEVTLRVTRLRTGDGDVVIIANGEIRQLVNRSKEWSRAVLDLPVSISEDIDLASSTLEEVGRELAEQEPWKHLLLDPPTVEGIESLDLTQVQVRLSARTLPGRQWEVGRELRRRSHVALQRAGVTTAPAEVSG